MPRPHQRSRNKAKDNQNNDQSTSSNVKSAQGTAPSSKRSTIPELVILNHGSPNNLLEFRRKLSIYAMRTFKDLVQMIELERYYVPPVINIPPAYEFEEDNDPGGFKKARQRIISDMEQSKPALYAVIWGQLSYESEEAIKLDPNWAAIERSKDPLALYKRLLEVHRTANSGFTVEDKRKSREEYSRMRQQSSETITQFKERFLQSLDAMKACGQDRPSDEDQAADFVNKLDNGRYAKFKTDLINNNTLGVGVFPQTLIEAFTLASRYVVAINSRNTQYTQSNEAVFVSQTKQPAQQRQTAQSKKSTEKKPNNPNSNISEKKQEKKNPAGGKKAKGACHLCGKSGHFMLDCNLLQECKAIIAERNDGDEINAMHVLNVEPDSVVLVNKRDGRNFKRFDVLLDNQATARCSRSKQC